MDGSPGTPHKTNTRRVFSRVTLSRALPLKCFLAHNTRRLSLSSQSQQGLALKATDFFFPLASRTKEGHFVNYLLVSDQQKVLSLNVPPTQLGGLFCFGAGEDLLLLNLVVIQGQAENNKFSGTLLMLSFSTGHFVSGGFL